MKTIKAFNFVQAASLIIIAPIFAMVFFIPWLCGTRFAVKRGGVKTGFIRWFKFYQTK